MEEDLQYDPRQVERTVLIEGQQVPLQEWEDEVVLRAAGWIACIRGGAGVLATALVLILPGIRANWYPCVPLLLGALGWLAVRSIDARTTLAVLCFVAPIAWMIYLGWIGVARYEFDRLDVFLACSVLAVVNGLLLFRRFPLARGALLGLSALYLVQWMCFGVLLPRVLGFRPGWIGQGLEEFLLIPTFELFPAGFVFYALASRPGRRLRRDAPERRRLAPLSSVREHIRCVRAVAAVLLIVVTLAGTLIEWVLVGKSAFDGFAW